MAAIKAYIQNQIKEDLEYMQMSLVEYTKRRNYLNLQDLEYEKMLLVEYIDPFTGELIKRNKK